MPHLVSTALLAIAVAGGCSKGGGGSVTTTQKGPPQPEVVLQPEGRPEVRVKVAVARSAADMSTFTLIARTALLALAATASLPVAAHAETTPPPAGAPANQPAAAAAPAESPAVSIADATKGIKGKGQLTAKLEVETKDLKG